MNRASPQRIKNGTRRGLARVRSHERVSDAAIARLRRAGPHGATVPPDLLDLLNEAEVEAAEIERAIAPNGDLSPQRALLLEEVTVLSVAARVLMRRFLRARSRADLATRAQQAYASRRSALRELGLERVAKDVESLDAILAQAAQDRARVAIDHKDDANLLADRDQASEDDRS